MVKLFYLDQNTIKVEDFFSLRDAENFYNNSIKWRFWQKLIGVFDEGDNYFYRIIDDRDRQTTIPNSDLIELTQCYFDDRQSITIATIDLGNWRDILKEESVEILPKVKIRTNVVATLNGIEIFNQVFDCPPDRIFDEERWIFANKIPNNATICLIPMAGNLP